METAPKNSRKAHRLEAKKRKVEAMLNLFEEDKSIIPEIKKKTGHSFGESYKALKDELKKYVKKPETEPNFLLTHHGLKARVNFKRPLADKPEPLFIEDVYQLLLRSVIGHQSPFPLNWAKLEQPQNISKTVLLVIEGFIKSDITENKSKVNNISTIFPHVVEIVSSNIPFASELSTLHLVTDFHIREKDTYSTMFPKEKEVKINASTISEKLTKLHLLLSPIQMAMENYPLPQSVFQYCKGENYVFTKESYTPVTKDSPLYAVDCEMCLTDAGMNELTRIAVIDENLDTIYHTLVKPQTKIINYLTKFSGITKDMLSDVNTTLSDVQKQLQTILPPNAILCGHSLENDLHALQMIHPYVIDTSIIFNCRGIRGKKDSLKNLAFTHLEQEIQNNKKGHHPVEDSIATMKLVQLKLQNSVQFGDACLDNTVDKMENSYKSGSNAPAMNGISTIKSSNDSNVKIVSKSKKDDGFFARLSQHSKKVCLVGSTNSLGHYSPEMLSDGVRKFVKSNRKKVVKATLKHIEEFDFIVSHLGFDSSSTTNSFEELDKIIQQIYSGCGDRTMFTVLLSGVDEAKFADIKSGLFMACLKKVK